MLAYGLSRSSTSTHKPFIRFLYRCMCVFVRTGDRTSFSFSASTLGICVAWGVVLHYLSACWTLRLRQMPFRRDSGISAGWHSSPSVSVSPSCFFALISEKRLLNWKLPCWSASCKQQPIQLICWVFFPRSPLFFSLFSSPSLVCRCTPAYTVNRG